MTNEINFEGYTCPVPIKPNDTVVLGHGSGGKLSHDLINRLFMPELGKALQARVPHFSAYGHALPGVAGQRPGQGGTPIVGEANQGKGPDQCQKPGCSINLGTGSVSENYIFSPVSSKGFSVILVLQHFSLFLKRER